MSIRTAKRGRTERGAALVEFAFIVPILFLILLGTLTGGLTLSRQNSVENAVREGTRFGAVYPADSADYLQRVHAQVIDGATGDLGSGAPARFICVAYVADDDVNDDAWKMLTQTGDAAAVETTGNWGADGPPCFDDGRDGLGEARVQVLAQRESDIEAILFSQTVTLKSQSVTRYER